MAPTLAPAALVVGAPRIPLPFGLFSVFTPRGGSADRWEAGGVFWETLSCDPVAGISMLDCDPAEMVGLPKELGRLDRDNGEANNFTVYGHHNCGPIGNTFEWAQSQANLHLELREEARVEQALWTGDLQNTPNFSGANGYAAPASVGSFPNTADGLKRAIAALEQHIAETYGSQGVIHMSRTNASLLEPEVKGGRLSTPLGTPIVAGTGYGDDRLVVTPQLFGYRSEIFNASGRPGDLLDRATNDMYAIAERTYLVGFDPCGLGAATLTSA